MGHIKGEHKNGITLALAVTFVLSLTFILSVFGAGIDTVNLISPDNATWTNDDNDTIAFTFNYTGENTTASCELFIDGTGYNINSTVYNDTQNTMYANDTISENTHTWYVNCTNTTTTQSSIWTLNIDRTSPDINFISPTPTNATSTSDTSIEINVSMVNASDLGELIWNWDGTNYTIFNDTLVLMLNFDNVSALGENDTYVVDASGSGNNGVVTGSTVNTSDCKFGNCFSFDGTDDFINVTDDASISGLSAITVSFWVKFGDFGPGGSDVNFIVSKSNWNTEREWRFRTEHSSGNPPNSVVWHISNDGNSPATENTTSVLKSSLSANNWYHFTGTYDANDAGMLRFYINGELKDNKTGELGGIFDGSASLAIGSSGDNGGVGTVDDFNGSIDEVRIWNRSLSADEVYQQYVSNLNKYDTAKWYLYVNQSKNATEVLDEGTYTHQTFVADSTGNQNSTEERTITIDLTEPDISFTSPSPDNQTTTANYTYINLTISESGYCLLDWNGTNMTMANDTGDTEVYYINRTSQPNGNYTFLAWCNDTTGNLNQSGSRWVYINWTPPDQTPPSVTITYPQNTTYYNVTHFNFTASDPNRDSCWYTTDGGSTNTTIPTCQNATTLSLTEGQTKLEVYSNDTVGNTGGSSVVFTLDQTEPTITINYPSNATITNDTFNVTFGETVNWSVFEVDSNGTNMTMGAVSTFQDTITGISDGLHNVTVYANDSVGNMNWSRRYWTRDTTAPALSTTFPSNYTNLSLTWFNITGTASDSNPNATNNLTINNSIFGSNLGTFTNWNFTNTSMDEGFYSVMITATDILSQQNSTELHFRIDRTGPTFTDIDNQTIQDDQALSYDINATDPSGISCFTVNDTTNFSITCAGVLTNASSLTAGMYWLTITANDTLNNQNSDIIYVNVSATDVTDPVVTITHPLNTTYYNVTHFNFTVVEANPDSCWYTNNSGVTNITINPCQNGTNLSLPEASYKLEVYSNDTSGNIGGDSVVFTLDQTEPEYSGLSQNISNQTEYNALYTYQFNSTWTDTSAGMDTVYFEWESTNYTASNTTSLYYYNLTGLAAGSYSYRWCGNDTVGNLNCTPTYTYEVAQASNDLIITGTGAITFPTQSSVDCSAIDGTPSLYRNDSPVSSPDTAILGAGTYNYTCNITASVNYTANWTTSNLQVNQNTTNPVFLHLNGSESDLTITYSQSVNASGYNYYAGAGTNTLYLDGVGVANPYIETPAAGTYTVVSNTTGNANYTANSTGVQYTLTINQIETGIDLYRNDTLWTTQYDLTVPETLVANGTINVSSLQASVNCYFNGTSSSNPNTTTYTTATYLNWSCIFAGNTNYTSSFAQQMLNVQVIDSTEPDLNFVSPTLSNNSYTNNVSWIYVNVSASESLDGCLLDNTTVNQTMTVSGDYCYFNWTGLANWTTHYFYVWGNDSSGNLNSTEHRSITINLTEYQADLTPPDIFNIANGTINSVTVTLAWNTTEPANSTVSYGTNSTMLNQTSTNTSLVLYHNLTLQSLTQNTTYYYNLTSCDSAGNCNTTGVYNFSTPNCTESWSCSAWSSCSGGTQTRSCTDLNSCGSIDNRPALSQSCDDDGGGGGGGSYIPPKLNVTAKAELVPGVGIINNTELQEAVVKVLDITNISDTARENLLRLSESITQNVSAERQMYYSGFTTKLRTTIKYMGEKKAMNFMVFETVPKSFAATASLVTVNAPGATVDVVEEDPSWLITFPEVNEGDDLEITYETSGLKSSTVPDNTKTEIYVESFQEAAPPEENVTGAPCTPMMIRCNNGNVEQCSVSGQWAVLEVCEKGCDTRTLSCIIDFEADIPQLPLNLQDLILAAIMLVLLVAVLVGYSRYKKRKKPKEEIQKLHKPEEISKYIKEGEPDVAIATVEKSAIRKLADKLPIKAKKPKREEYIEEKLEDMDRYVPIATLEIKKEEPDLSLITRDIERVKEEIKKGKPETEQIKRKGVKMEDEAEKHPEEEEKPAKVRAPSLEEIHRITRKKYHKKHRKRPSKRIRDTDRKIAKMNEIVVKMPEIRMNLEQLRGEMEGHHEALAEARHHEESIKNQAEEVMSSVSDLREHLLNKMKKKKIEEKETEKMLKDAAETMDKKVDMISRKLDEALDKLSRRVDNASKLGKIEMTTNISYLKNQIDGLRAELPKFAKKEDIKKARRAKEDLKISHEDAQPDVPPRADFEVPKEQKKDREQPVEETQPVVKIAELEVHKGEEVVIDCEVKLTKTVEEEETKLYGYSLKDDTGEIMMTSMKEIKEPRARLRCKVNETPDGKVYLRFVKTF
ncbi:MAG: hypothetical protein JSV63_02655 [Candidatus Aenigmatarchaeota archaeon]|nr:MAG: hypothetical protein JSV63_02655 [Candidatus Aenigmarchaeota archaeon]